MAITINNNILKNVSKNPGSENVNRFCELIEEISRERSSMWLLSWYEKDGEILITFLKKLVAKGCISQIDRIFSSGGNHYPLVNEWSKLRETRDKFDALFQMLPQDYQDKLLGETMHYYKGDKIYICSLIYGTHSWVQTLPEFESILLTKDNKEFIKVLESAFVIIKSLQNKIISQRNK